MPSDSIDELPVKKAATNFAAAIKRLAAIAP
jgi:hypothetical protein